jgi:hypothetical protein
MSRKIDYTATLDPSGFERGSLGITTALNTVHSRMTEVGKSIQFQADGISGKWSSLASVFAGVGASLGLVAFGTMIHGAIEGAAKLHDVSQQSGIAVGALSALAAVGKTSETSLESIAAASNRLAKNLSVATEESAGTTQAIKALGIDLDSFKSMAPEERMKVLATSLDGVRDGADKTAMAMALFGKQGAELLPFLSDLAQTGELQARVTEEQAAQADNFTDNLVKLKSSGEGWKKELAMGMLPALNEASTATLKVMNGTGGLRDEIRKLAADGTLAEWTRAGVRGLTYVLDVVQYVGRGIKWVGELIGAAASQAVQLAQGNFREAAAIGADFNARSVELFSAETLGSRLRTSLDEARGAIDEVLQPKKDIKFNARSDETKAKKEVDPSLMAYYDAALAEEKRLSAEKNALREYSKEQERDYWQNLLQNADLSGKDRVSISKKVAELELQILRDKAKQQQALEMEDLKVQQDRALGAVEQARQEAESQYQLGEISKAELLDQERGFEEQRNEIKRQYLEARLAMIDPDRDPVAYAQASAQIEELERQHRMRLKQIQIEQAVDAKNNPFARTFEAAQQSMATAIEGMINRTMTLKQALTSIWAGIRQAIVKEIATIIARKVAAWAVERAMALAGIGANAAKAGSGAASAVASIPYVGPVLAIAAMAAMLSAVGGMSSKVPSAARGFDIPAGMNPLTQLHEQEMVLPAEHANTIRALSAGGAGGGRIELKAVPMPGNFFMIHRDALASALRELHRDGSITLG